MKKILFVTHAIGEGGAQRVTTLLANEFSKRGYSIRIVTLAPCKYIYYLEKDVQYIPINARQKHTIFRSVYRIIEINRHIKQFKPDCIISLSAISNMLTILACGMRHIRVVVAERTDPSMHPKSKIVSIIRTILYRYCADMIVFQTKDQKEWFSKGIQKKGIIIPNAVMPDLMEPNQEKRIKVISGVGSLSDQKNWMVAIKAFELFLVSHDDYKFIIWGEGAEREKLEDYISTHESLRDKVLLPGYSENVHQKICRSAIFVSSALYDGISNSILEAMALGLPCVCTDARGGGARFLIQNGINGILVDIGDYHSMAIAMAKIADDEEFANKCASNAVKVRQQYNMKKIFEYWEKIINVF